MPPTIPPTSPRVVSDLSGLVPGPTLIVTVGIHGNEPASVVAAQRVREQLLPLRSRLKGRWLVLLGNRRALRVGQRYIDRDLNRGWSRAKLQSLAACPRESLDSEDAEQRDLFEHQEAAVLSSVGPAYFLDLHTTSARSIPFVCFGDTLNNRKFALSFPLTAILGLEEVIDGAMLGYWTDRGYTAIAVEAGQHDAPDTVERHVAVLWLALVVGGLLDAGDVPDHGALVRRLRADCREQPRVVEIVHRHVVEPEDEFEMLPGFASFDRVTSGQVLARDRHGPICAPRSGRILMPRYQGLGEDGFFLVRPVASVWLRLSRWLRGEWAGGLLPLVPGVSRLEGSGSLRVEPARLGHRVVDLMHLCGYRRRRRSGPWEVFSRRPSERHGS